LDIYCQFIDAASRFEVFNRDLIEKYVLCVFE